MLVLLMLIWCQRDGGDKGEGGGDVKGRFLYLCIVTAPMSPQDIFTRLQSVSKRKLSGGKALMLVVFLEISGGLRVDGPNAIHNKTPTR